MADQAPSTAEDSRRRGRRRGRVPDHVGDRCTMCGRMVAVDAHGRCALGHQVISVEQARARRGDDADAVDHGATSAEEPSPDEDVRDPSAALVATYVEPTRGAGRRAPTPQPPRVFDDPPPPLPGATPPRSLLTEDRTVAASSHGRATVSVSDLTPAAASALDVDDATWTPGDAPSERRYAQVPVDDNGEEPPRGLLRMIAGGLFVAVLLGVAWYLATSL